MVLRIILIVWVCSPILIALILCAFHRKTLFGDRSDDASDCCADEGAWPRVDPSFHETPTSYREQHDHA